MASVVICTYGTERLNDTISCVESVLNQSRGPDEVILVADKNEELIQGLKEVTGDSRVKMVVCEEKGLSNARNMGIKEAKGDIICFIDDDAFAHVDWLKVLLENFKDENVMVAGGDIIPEWDGERPFWFPKELDWVVGCIYEGHPECRTEVRNVIGCNMAFRKCLFERVGYFRKEIGRVGKKLLAGEETEFCMRVMDKIPGAKIIYEPGAKVGHRVPAARARLKYVLERSYFDGISKAKIKKLLRDIETSSHEAALSTENRYVKYLITRSIPKRVKDFIKGRHMKENVAQIIVLGIATEFTLMGYLHAKI